MILGSLSCPMTSSSMPTLKRLHSEFGDRVEFVTVNVREAHPGENIPQPDTLIEKHEHARIFKERYDPSWTVAVDDIDGTLHRALDGKPNAADLMDTKGKLVFRALWASDERGLRQALRSVSAGQAPAKGESRAMMAPMARAMGHVNRIMKTAGPQAERDLLMYGTPMAITGKFATLFNPLSQDWGGVAAVTTMSVSMVAAVVLAIGVAVL